MVLGPGRFFRLNLLRDRRRGRDVLVRRDLSMGGRDRHSQERNDKGERSTLWASKAGHATTTSRNMPAAM